jgi:uncharacterized protein YkwD
VTRRGLLIAMAAALAATAAIGGSALAADARRATFARGAQALLMAPYRPVAGARTRRPREPRTCGTTHKRPRGGGHAGACRRAARNGAGRARHGSELRPRALRTKLSTPLLAAAENAAGTIAKVLATPCQNTQLVPEPGNVALVRGAVLCLINTERARNGRGPLSPDARLEAAAEGHGREMLSLDYFDHIAPSGLTPVERVRETGYIPASEAGYVIGENLAWGTLSLATPQAIVSAWIASPEHLANILEDKYRQTGIDVEPEVPDELSEGVAGALYTQEFGVIVH